MNKTYNGIHLATWEECKKLNGGKWVCPECGKKTFVCYVDFQLQIINEKVGRCDREDKCRYHFTPKQYFSDKGMVYDRPITQNRPKPKPKPEPQISYTDVRIFKETRNYYDKNNFVIFLKSKFNPNLVNKAIGLYNIGTYDWFGGGSTVFWQIDRFGRIHCGKVMQFNVNNGKRVKEPYSMITWVHSVMKLPDYNLKQCLFGEHLLRKYPNRGVAVVESEKTAIIASMMFPDCIFVAVGGKSKLSEQMCLPLKDRDVIIFPDNNAYDDWSEKAKSISYLFKSYIVSDIMEHEAVEHGDDIGDLILRNANNKDFSIPSLAKTAPSDTPENAVEEQEEEQRTTEPEEQQHAPERTIESEIGQTKRSCPTIPISTCIDNWRAANPDFAECGKQQSSVIDTRLSILNQFQAINPSFMYLCERLDLAEVGTETAPSGHQTFVAVDEKTYYFDEHGIFHFYRTPEQEQMMKRFHKTDVCPF